MNIEINLKLKTILNKKPVTIEETIKDLKESEINLKECYNPNNLNKGIFVKIPLTNNWSKE